MVCAGFNILKLNAESDRPQPKPYTLNTPSPSGRSTEVRRMVPILAGMFVVTEAEVGLVCSRCHLLFSVGAAGALEARACCRSQGVDTVWDAKRV